ncbi:glutamate synthase large subunit [Thomasclavelia cocleata]|uniref:glutamate synthase large subunit n=1 Tax=Thomasclavelia cocleata TaxID=69824 RepID=UPI002729B446|nr:glutamate synthase large subunit [Thomasclavelia cocleata]
MEENNLYNPSFEHDNCGIGAVVNIKGIQTYKTVNDALKIVQQLEHRAGKDATGEIGDGVGILTQIPYQYLKKVVTQFELPEKGCFGVGMFFMPQDEKYRARIQKMFETIIRKEGMRFIGWREVPVNPSVLGQFALDAMPYITQAFIEKNDKIKKGLDFDRKLYQARRMFEHSQFKDTYVCSLSSRTIVYKGMFLVHQLRSFYKDLQDTDYQSAIALVHSRFSTNTMPSWQRAHPNRFIVHNGEINTIKGNANNMLCREENMYTTKIDTKKVYPVVDETGSDSAMLDNTLEFLVMSGMELPRAVMLCIPEPYENDKNMSQVKRDFYQYNATLMEPWDGPASILFSDGDVMGAVLDRNGLRPSRYYITKDHYLVLSSEVGALDIPAKDIILKERLRPGKMLLVDTKKGELINNDDLKLKYATKQPYGEWLETNLLKLADIKIPNTCVNRYKNEELTKLQMIHGYSYEDTNYIKNLALTGSENIIAMGNDAPLAVLSKNHPPLFNYFKQLFAQVTNPPIDAIREEMITSTSICIGKDGNMLEDTSKNCQLIKIDHPVLSNTDLLKIKELKDERFKVGTVDITYIKNTSLEKAIERVFVEVDQAYHTGCNIVILSDRGVDDTHLPIPSLLAIGAVNSYLVRTKKRNSLALILEVAEPREVHHYATLLGYGASAINGYLAQDTIYHLIEEGLLDKDYYAAVDDYNNGILHGIVKIASKMGISTIQSYRGSQNFEVIGLSSCLVDKYFPKTITRIEGKTIKDIEEDVEYRHNKVYDPLGLDVDIILDSAGDHKRRSCKEEHLYNPATIHKLQLATRLGDYHIFKEYTKMIDEESEQIHLRGLMTFKEVTPISINEVESVDNIVRRFKTGAMSYGSISKEAHETMAIAMNRLHGQSNSGEGGEDEERFHVLPNGDSKCSAIKQVASGRFGVTSEYLCSAREIQIKMAQGAKPGEGGHLPGGKVYPWIAKTRHSTPGVGLISPPPHHDIYSIEDLAQLIYDLKNANRDSRISVKLVSEAGVGTIAAGVAKAGAGVILISGHDGGTGAAPRSSVYNAGLPWELGLAEAHQTLIMNNLRSRVVLETDGKLMTGRDLAIATLLGAEEYGFATAPLVTMGCVMMRVCNLDTCPVGVATQNPILRKRFTGKPEYVENFMRFIAQELREYMAQLGFRTIQEMVGRVDLLKVKDKKAENIDLTRILHVKNTNVCFDSKNMYDFKLNLTKDCTILENQLLDALKKRQSQEIDVQVSNIDRSFGTLFGSDITRRYGNSLEEDFFKVNCYGSGGQSFGAFIPKGLNLSLHGDSNDYFGKGLSGGKLVVVPPEGSVIKAEDNIIIGNVALYGATSGEAYINGIAGERFAVRNSGAIAVVEGVGDHGLEYMTGCIVVVLGKTGRNFAAGMSGGIAYIYDPDKTFYSHVNKELIEFTNVSQRYDEEQIKKWVDKHYQHTKSAIAKKILDNFDVEVKLFKKVIPHDYKKMMNLISSFEQQGLSKEQAKVEAFNTFKKGV